MNIGRPRTLPEPEPRACLNCETVFTPIRKKPHQIYCNVDCQRAACMRPKELNAELARETAEFRGDLQRGSGQGIGYVKHGGRHEHRVVMEEKLGRPLRPGEIVHHIDGDKQNNDPDNLEVMTQSEHATLHSTKNRICELPECNEKHYAKGMCRRHYRQSMRG